MARVCLDLGHTGGTGGRPGAEYGGRFETLIVRRYAIEAAEQLEAAGHTVDIAGQGTYSSRQHRAVRDGAGVYVACHVNAGYRPGYGPAVFHPAHGLGSITLAGHLAHHIEQTLGRCRVWATTPDDWTKRAHSLTVHAQAGLCAAVVYEPCFIDGPGPHLALLDNPKRLGGMLSAGILDFVEGR